MKETSAVAISEKGLITLPDNFEKLTERKQKSLIVAILAEYGNAIASGEDLDEREAKELKALSLLIKNSKEGKRLEALRRSRAERRRAKEMLLIERNGVLKVAKRMGLDITEEIKKLKEIS